MICEECHKESQKEDVCTNCGLVLIDRPLVNRPMRRIHSVDDIEQKEFEKVLAPHIMYSNVIRLNECHNPNLKRGLKMNRHSDKHTFEKTYAVVFQEINRISYALQIPKSITLDVRLLFRNILEKIPNFLVKFKTQTTIAACFFVVYQIHGYVCDKNAVFELLKTSYSKETVENLTQKAYRVIMSNYKFPTRNNDFPQFINYIGYTLKSKQYWITRIHNVYNQIRQFFKCQYNIKGYILAIFAHFGVSIELLTQKFDISAGTIKKRLKEIRGFIK